MTYAPEYYGSQTTVISTTTTPVEDDAQRQFLAKDYSKAFASETAADSRLIFSVRKCVGDASPDIQIDNIAGILVMAGVGSPTVSDGSVTRDSASQVSVYLKADAFDHLNPGKYRFDLTEITSGGQTYLHRSGDIFLIRSAGRVMAS